MTARTLAERVASLLDVSRKLGAKIHEYTGHSTPIMLQPSAVASRIGGRIAAVMATVPGCRARLGGVQWLGGSLYPPEVNWRAQEVKHLWREIEEIIGGDK